ncbi:REC8 meiotic recombination protein b [Megalops cyprinoides]|uniref:REC8 meiotic recombination protein b n=1 Tax=Megalops cyprinoides TaxID=118141 RepID=UPI001864AF06|nr:REC8 meiotic recombination protein b [Megalops cyprinoides]
MFYYPYVLQRHTGCFSTIWLAATKGIKITRRDFLKVNVERTCEDIMDYVLAQAPPLCPGLPRPRFSLYLSSQLQYGVIIVYHQQCAILQGEVQQTIERLLRSERHTRIDLMEPDRRTLNLPDSLFLLEEAEGAQDPFFGVMGIEQNLPSPYRLMQAWHDIEAVTPQHPQVGNRTSAPEEGLTASPDAITMKEKEPAVIPSTEFEGEELPEVTVKEIDMLMEQQDQFNVELEERERERVADGERTALTGATVSIEQLKLTTLEDSMWLLDEETGRPVEVPLTGVRMEKTPSPVSVPVAPPSRESMEEPEKERERGREGSSSEILHGDIPPKQQGRRRQLLFIDPQMQIPQDEMQAQIQDNLAETVPLSQVLLGSPSQLRVQPAELLSAACCCEFPAFLSHRQRPGVTNAELESEREIEVAREETEGGSSAVMVSAASEVLLEVSKEDGSRDHITPTKRWSPIEAAPVPMEEIPEERVELPEGEVTVESLLGLVSLYLKRFGEISFDSLLHPKANRSIAARVFCKLLGI